VSSDLLIRASIFPIVLSLIALVRRYLPPKSTDAIAYSLEELKGRFAATQWLVGVSMLLVGGTIAWGTYSILVESNRIFADLEGPSDFVLLPQRAIWWFLPGFAGVTFSWDITLGMWSLIGDKNEVAMYNYWTNATAGFDGTRALRFLAVVIVLPIAILTALAIPQHDVLRGEEIRTRGYGFSGTRTYRYSDARGMTIIEGFRQRDGTLVKRAGVVLDFSDGRRWSSAHIGDFKPGVDQEFVHFLEAKTGLVHEYADTESGISKSPRPD
jgi:hypothetical protein